MKNTLFKSSNFAIQKSILVYHYKNNALQNMHEYIPRYQTIRLTHGQKRN